MDTYISISKRIYVKRSTKIYSVVDCNNKFKGFVKGRSVVDCDRKIKSLNDTYKIYVPLIK